MAREAGVSRATVSYVLNDRRDMRVSDATRERVLEVARRIGYIGSPAARALRSGRGDVVLLLLPGWEVGGQLALLLEEIGQRVAQQGLVCLRYEGAHWQGKLNTVLAHIPAACVVTFDPLIDDDSRALESAGVPEVAARLLDYPGKLHTTAIEQAGIVAAQIDHLLEQGYRRLAYFAMDEPRGRLVTDARVTAFTSICQERGVIDAKSVTVSADQFSITGALAKCVSQSDEPLGIAAWNDLAGLGIISAAAELGISIPEQLGIIGGDDTPIAALTRPPLSSVRFNLQVEAAGIAAQISTALGQVPDHDIPTAEVVQVIGRQSSNKRLISDPS
ncbi:LacI family DNA-binding transcriptional regulator [Pseudarthrobacter equi]|uniref:LacI family DNA-binding transcriptional regulator n=1 Tax=Pseudarthrobacter equi TaxID=728066 RepID=UPI0021C1AA09|nr:LacI family DNA-binding transcriptional regulator [Pseudarthrobacter equi]MCT9623962.1 LacI family DNA-binding transcriptional regulator [Pseudarthrobacter equi]